MWMRDEKERVVEEDTTPSTIDVREPRGVDCTVTVTVGQAFPYSK